MRSARLGLVLLVALTLVLAACANSDSSDSTQNNEAESGLLDWRRDADTMIVRLDRQSNKESVAYRLNTIPLCTLWGDGRVVWTTQNEDGLEEVLEARVPDTTIRAFLEDIINRGFYDWEDELFPPSDDTRVESLTVSLYDEVRTVRRYSYWPQNGFSQVLEACQSMAGTSVRVLPAAGWISAYSVPRNTQSPTWYWPTNAPFTLEELAASGESRWIESELATRIWQVAREDVGNIQVVGQSDQAYQVAIVVPGYSRDTVAPPEAASAE